MDGAALLDSVRTEMETELARLGSEKSLLAATEARLETDRVLVTAAAVLASARETVAEWATVAADDRATETLDATAGTLAEAFAAVMDELAGDSDAVTDVEAPFMSLSAAGDAGRVAAATIGLPLVLDRVFLQVVSFFVNEADSARADLFRDLRADTDAMLEAGQETLDVVCQDWDRAHEAAVGVVEAAYEDYAQRLDVMGFDPKPIC